MRCGKLKSFNKNEMDPFAKLEKVLDIKKGNKDVY